MRKRLGCLSTGGIVAALLTLAVVGLLVLFTGGALFSPGPLNATTGPLPLGGVTSHAAIGGRCSACHVAPWSELRMTDRCLTCHTAVRDRLGEPTTLHGALQVALGALDCRDCHPEHRGAAGLLTLVDADNFPHQAVGFSLAGHGRSAAGEPFACRDCHGDDLTTLDPAVCLTCHQELDPPYIADHRAAFGDGCLACHDGVDTYGGNFDHDRLPFPLLGGHASVPCAGCHAGARSPAALRQAPGDCEACHQEDDAHDGQFGTACGGCHTPESWQEATFDHSITAFPLTGAHLEVACDACHVDRLFAGTPQACGECHAEPEFHQGALGTDCGACHEPSGWSPARYDRFHQFPMDHEVRVASPCRTCHPDQLLAYTCYGCHEHDPAEIREEHIKEGITDFQDCVRCHPTGLEDEAEDWDN